MILFVLFLVFLFLVFRSIVANASVQLYMYVCLCVCVCILLSQTDTINSFASLQLLSILPILSFQIQTSHSPAISVFITLLLCVFFFSVVVVSVCHIVICQPSAVAFNLTEIGSLYSTRHVTYIYICIHVHTHSCMHASRCLMHVCACMIVS